jgi:hypothetical protein
MQRALQQAGGLALRLRVARYAGAQWRLKK